MFVYGLMWGKNGSKGRTVENSANPRGEMEIVGEMEKEQAAGQRSTECKSKRKINGGRLVGLEVNEAQVSIGK